MDSIIASIHPEWWEKIKSGEKLLEIRKTMPTKVSFPFKIIWYETGGIGIVGESICPEIIWDQSDYMPLVSGSCLTQPELWEYAGGCEGTAGSILYGWQLEDTLAYGGSTPLSEYGVKRPPQSWQYYFIGKKHKNKNGGRIMNECSNHAKVKEIAAKLCGMAYRENVREIEAEAKEHDIVIVMGASDDLMEFSGAINDEGGCYDGGEVYFDRDGVSYDDDDEKANVIEAIWCGSHDENGIPATWAYETEIPHEKFKVFDDGELYCIGIVFSVEDLK